MTPEERRRVADLFDRLAQLENSPREQEAERMIAEGLQLAPNAAYALVQTVLLQEEALARANQRIGELEARLSTDERLNTGGFLDTLRGALAGQAAAPRRGSVPSVGGRSAPMGVPPGFEQHAESRGGPGEIGRGGSFLGQAASIAAGVVAGSLVVDALRGQFGSQAGSAKASEAQAQQASAGEQDGAAEQQPGYQEADYETAEFDDGGFDGGDLV